MNIEHDLHCSALRSRPVGGRGCSCYVETKLSAAKARIAKLEENLNRNGLGCIKVETAVIADNLSLVLASYFSLHDDRPEDDEENEDNYYHGDWVMGKVDEALDLIAEQLKGIK